MARLLEVIEAIEKEGSGSTDDPVRAVTRFYDKEGNFLGQHDPAGEVCTFNALQEVLRKLLRRIAELGEERGRADAVTAERNNAAIMELENLCTWIFEYWKIPPHDESGR